MAVKNFQYVIIGGGLAGASAIEGIREIDHGGPILLAGLENDLPYDRPHLSKKLWFGKKTVEQIFIHDKVYYDNQHIDLLLGTEITGINPIKKTITTDKGDDFGYKKLLLATGGNPRKLNIPGGNLDEIIYFRTLDDYKNLRGLASTGKKAVIIGGGFIGSEIAAALKINNLDVTMIFPEDYIVQRIFPENLGKTVQKFYIEKGIVVVNGDVPVSFEKMNGRIITKTGKGKEIRSDIVIAGIGIAPNTVLAEKAGLKTGNGIIADEYLCTSNPDIFSAGDNTNFMMAFLDKRMRLEHWDNSIQQGKAAGRNMAGASIKFDVIPYFFSDLFDFGYEAAGEINSQLQIQTVWKKENDTGIIYYISDGIVKGVMLCNVWDKIEAARELIKKQNKINPEELKTAIPF